MTSSVLETAVIDDDPIEVEILEGIAQTAGVADQVRFTPFRTLRAFIGAPGAGSFDAAFLDRRLPDSDNFKASMTDIAEAGVRLPLVLMSATHAVAKIDHPDLPVIGPVDKLAIVQPKRFRNVIAQLLRHRDAPHRP